MRLIEVNVENGDSEDCDVNGWGNEDDEDCDVNSWVVRRRCLKSTRDVILQSQADLSALYDNIFHTCCTRFTIVSLSSSVTLLSSLSSLSASNQGYQTCPSTTQKCRNRNSPQLSAVDCSLALPRQVLPRSVWDNGYGVPRIYNLGHFDNIPVRLPITDASVSQCR